MGSLVDRNDPHDPLVLFPPPFKYWQFVIILVFAIQSSHLVSDFLML